MSKVPKFGNWQTGDNSVPYTAYFDKARKGRQADGRVGNPNDPQENPALFEEHPQPPRGRDDHLPEAPRRYGAGSKSPAPERAPAGSRSPLRERVAAGSKTPVHERATARPGPTATDPIRRGQRENGGFDKVVEHPPQVQKYDAKSTRSNPDRRGPAEGSKFAPPTPSKSTRQGGRYEDHAPKAPAIPKFGQWDEKNPSTADGYTHIFEKVREERHNGPPKSPMVVKEHPVPITHRRSDDEPTGKCSCTIL